MKSENKKRNNSTAGRKPLPKEERKSVVTLMIKNKHIKALGGKSVCKKIGEELLECKADDFIRKNNVSPKRKKQNYTLSPKQ